MAEAFVRRLTAGLPVAVRSFGTLQLGPAPALAEACKLGAAYGVDLSEHRARLIGGESTEDADLLIGFEEEHVRRAVIDGSTSTEGSFTFRQIVALLEDIAQPDITDVVQRARIAVKEAAALRAAAPVTWGAAPIADPFGRSWRVYRETAEEIRELSSRLVEALFGVSGTGVLLPLPTKLAQRWARRKR
jgi:protein-tyrosine-phosphatase